MNKVAIAATTYNNPEHIKELIKSCQEQTIQDYELFIADDGSKDNTVEVIQSFADKNNKIHLFALEHGERGLARQAAIKEALKNSYEFLLIIDSDMMLEKDLLESAINYFDENKNIDALVIKEIPYSNYSNYYTKVKVFERKIINNSSNYIDQNSIEAARFWRRESYISTGGINPQQVAFEEIQPTIRCIEKGGIVRKLMVSGLYHDEKKVTFLNIMMKKRYYFKMMNKTIETEKSGTLKALKRWYLFRPVYYKKENLKLYIKYPLLTLGVLNMYLGLTFIGVFEVLKHKISHYN